MLRCLSVAIASKIVPDANAAARRPPHDIVGWQYYKGADSDFHPKTALACICWLAGAGLSLVKTSV